MITKPAAGYKAQLVRENKFKCVNWSYLKKYINSASNPSPQKLYRKFSTSKVFLPPSLAFQVWGFFDSTVMCRCSGWAKMLLCVVWEMLLADSSHRTSLLSGQSPSNERFCCFVWQTVLDCCQNFILFPDWPFPFRLSQPTCPIFRTCSKYCKRAHPVQQGTWIFCLLLRAFFQAHLDTAIQFRQTKPGLTERFLS